MEKWISEQLSEILDFVVPDDLIHYILSINDENDFNEYMKTLIDFNNIQHKTFYLELSKKKFPCKGQSPPKTQKKKISKNKQNQDILSSTEPLTSPESETEIKSSKKKTKYINLYSQEGKNAQVVQLKGRHHCDCQASKHQLINNCLKCGRVVCSQEGSGPCLFCGTLVCTPEEQKEINAKTKASAKLVESLLVRNRPKGWEAAISHRNRLLEYDRTSERRTHVTDDDSDYFNTNSVWLNETEKEKLQKYQQSLHEKKHASRLQKKITFDFAGRTVVEDKSIEYEVDEVKIREMTGGAGGAGGGGAPPSPLPAGGDRDVAPDVNAAMLQFDPAVEGYASIVKQGCPPTGGLRVQDAEIQEMIDSGRCLSMDQPWASLLIEGIKRHEGRTWYTSHRGRLWIAATAKQPHPVIVDAAQSLYTKLYPNKTITFPSFYPAGCLLGCITVDDCLPLEEYHKQYPKSETSDSPYIFICSNPISLRLRYPVKGQHKIYNLDKTIHQAAVKYLQKMGKMQSEANAG